MLAVPADGRPRPGPRPRRRRAARARARAAPSASPRSSRCPAIGLRRSGFRLRLGARRAYRDPEVRSVLGLSGWAALQHAGTGILLAAALIAGGGVAGGVVAYQLAMVVFLAPVRDRRPADPHRGAAPAGRRGAARTTRTSLRASVRWAADAMVVATMPIAALLTALSAPVMAVLAFGEAAEGGGPELLGAALVGLADRRAGLRRLPAAHPGRLRARATAAPRRWPRSSSRSSVRPGCSPAAAATDGSDTLVLIGLAHTAAYALGAIALALRLRGEVGWRVAPRPAASPPALAVAAGGLAWLGDGGVGPRRSGRHARSRSACSARSAWRRTRGALRLLGAVPPSGPVAVGGRAVVTRPVGGRPRPGRPSRWCRCPSARARAGDAGGHDRRRRRAGAGAVAADALLGRGVPGRHAGARRAAGRVGGGGHVGARRAARTRPPGDGYAAMSAGARARGVADGGPGARGRRGLPRRRRAGRVRERHRGRRRPTGCSRSAFPALVERNDGLDYGAEIGALGEALDDAGVPRAVIANADGGGFVPEAAVPPHGRRRAGRRHRAWCPHGAVSPAPARAGTDRALRRSPRRRTAVVAAFEDAWSRGRRRARRGLRPRARRPVRRRRPSERDAAAADGAARDRRPRRRAARRRSIRRATPSSWSPRTTAAARSTSRWPGCGRRTSSRACCARGAPAGPGSSRSSTSRPRSSTWPASTVPGRWRDGGSSGRPTARPPVRRGPRTSPTSTPRVAYRDRMVHAGGDALRRPPGRAVDRRGHRAAAAAAAVARAWSRSPRSTMLAYLPATYLARLIDFHDARPARRVLGLRVRGRDRRSAVAGAVVGRAHHLDPLLLCLVAIFGLLTVDMLIGAPLQLNAVFGYSPTVGGRFAGMGNLAYGHVRRRRLPALRALVRAGWRRARTRRSSRSRCWWSRSSSTACRCGAPTSAGCWRWCPPSG